MNGNPFIRYDGYYILSDIVGIENLMSRSGEYFKQWWRWHFLRLGSRPASKHGLFMLCYGIGCFIYRIFLYTSIILVIYHKFVKAVALVMVFLEIYSILIYPAYREIQTIRILSQRSVNRARLFIAAALPVVGGFETPLWGCVFEVAAIDLLPLDVVVVAGQPRLHADVHHQQRQAEG